MADSTRPTQIRHQARAVFAAGLMACSCALPALASTSTTEPGKQDQTASVNPAPLSAAIQTVASGQEGLELSGRFSQNGDVYVQGIDWQIKDQTGATVYRQTAATADFKLQPGAYEVIASYGTVKIDETFNIVPNTKLSVNLVLNAGALRVLPRLKGIDGEQVPSTSRIFALNGIANGKLITTTQIPGELVKLAVGSYRIESHFDDSNVTAVTDVDVKSGIMRSINIDHHAGVAHFSIMGASKMVQWTVTPDHGETLAIASGIEARAVLKPGHYVAAANFGTSTLKKPFVIDEGQVQDVILGN